MIILNLFSCVLFFEPKITMVEEGLAPEIIVTLDAVTIVVEKELRQLSLYSEQKLVKIDGKPAQWHVGLGDAPLGHKQAEGDERTPEGSYYISDHSESSSYHGSILIHYPNTEDAKAGLETEQITEPQYKEIIEAEESKTRPPMNTKLGGWLLIHGSGKASGLPSKAGEYDWTNGCVAMSNDDLDELRRSLGKIEGKVLILP